MLHKWDEKVGQAKNQIRLIWFYPPKVFLWIYKTECPGVAWHRSCPLARLCSTVSNPNPNQHGETNHPCEPPLQAFWALLHVIYATRSGENYDNYGIDYALQHGSLQISPKSTQYPINPQFAIWPPQKHPPPFLPPLQVRYITHNLVTNRIPPPSIYIHINSLVKEELARWHEMEVLTMGTTVKIRSKMHNFMNSYWINQIHRIYAHLDPLDSPSTPWTPPRPPFDLPSTSFRPPSWSPPQYTPWALANPMQ